MDDVPTLIGSDTERRRRAVESNERLRPGLRLAAEELLCHSDCVAFLARLDKWFPHIHAPLENLYSTSAEETTDELVEGFVRSALEAAAQRSQSLRDLDRRREIDPLWHQSQSMLGYVAYPERFAGTIADLSTRLDYLAELGVTYLHLLPVLAAREGANDGGYAVRDYRQVDPRLGSIADLENLTASLRGRGISLCIDLVLNHTAREHPWARGWVAGEAQFANYYIAYPDRTIPDIIEEAAVAEAFPQQAPGSFTWVPEALGGVGGWVWTTFYDYQWDLNFAEPKVLSSVLATMLWLANRGVEVFRLDATPCLWKRLGGANLNEPKVHDVLQALRGLVKLAAPAVIFKAEAMVLPADLVRYLGGHERYRPECELAYHNQLMIMLWSSVATKDARLAVQSLSRMPAVPRETSLATYLRGHDEIGWALDGPDVEAVGYSPNAHRQFLNNFYSGSFPMSFAKGAVYEENEKIGDGRVCGTTAALCGISDALDRHDSAALEQAIRRFILLHAVIYSWGGIPLLYMGDELAQGNDEDYVNDTATAADKRWMHRPHFDETAAARRNNSLSLEGRIFNWLVALGSVRRVLPALDAANPTEVLSVDGSPTVLAWRRRHPCSGWFVGLANFAEHPVLIDSHIVGEAGQLELVLSSDGPLIHRDDQLELAGLSFAWFAEP